MQYRIIHRTLYRYSQPVQLAPQQLHLRPRTDGGQQLQAFSLDVAPSPQQRSESLDAEGNIITQLSFNSQLITEFSLTSHSQVVTIRSNPFDYIAEPWAIQLPFGYPPPLQRSLQPYLRHSDGVNPAPSPSVTDWAQTILHQQQNNASYFLTELNQTINRRSEYRLRETGEPQPAGVTLNQNIGSCRDFSVLFVEACRAVGLAARFVSGYQAGDLDQDERHLHAWAEVYLPGGGWRGFDPTLGLAVADAHVAIAAAAEPAQAAPVIGKLRRANGATTELQHSIELELL